MISGMLSGLGYLILAATVVGSIFLAFETKNYLFTFIVFWLGLTVGTMLIMKYKED